MVHIHLSEWLGLGCAAAVCGAAGPEARIATALAAPALGLHHRQLLHAADTFQLCRRLGLVSVAGQKGPETIIVTALAWPIGLHHHCLFPQVVLTDVSHWLGLTFVAAVSGAAGPGGVQCSSPCTVP